MKKVICVGLIVAAMGCATYSAKKEMQGALAAVQSAQAAGADSDRQAHSRLSQAEAELGRARALLQGGNSKDAKSAAQTAYGYAEQALQIVRSKAHSSPAAASLTQ